MVDVEKMQKKKKLLFHEGKNKIKGATQSEWTLFKIAFFICLKDHKGSIIVWIVIKVFEIFSI
jgi:hypothetical protein